MNACEQELLTLTWCGWAEKDQGRPPPLTKWGGTRLMRPNSFTHWESVMRPPISERRPRPAVLLTYKYKCACTYLYSSISQPATRKRLPLPIRGVSTPAINIQMSQNSDLFRGPWRNSDFTVPYQWGRECWFDFVFLSPEISQKCLGIYQPILNNIFKVIGSRCVRLMTVALLLYAQTNATDVPCLRREWKVNKRHR